MEDYGKHASFGDGIDWNFHIGQVLEGGSSVFYQLTPEWKEVTNNIKSNILDKYIGDPKLLDCGCHVGRWSELFKQAGFEYTGVDQSKQVIETAKRLHPETNFVERFLWDMGYDKEFDCAVCVAVLQHNQLHEKKKIVPAIFKALKPGGVFLFLESTVLNETATQLTHDGWIELINSFGFEFLESEHKNELGFEDHYLVRRPL